METLSGSELAALIKRVFSPEKSDQALAVLVDLPDREAPDNPAWKERRLMARDWVEKLQRLKGQTGLEAHLVLYRNVHSNNAELPEQAWVHTLATLPATAEDLNPATAKHFSFVFRNHSILLAPTEFSPTAPLKLAAPEYGFRAATMPGFSSRMIPALKLDYEQINQRVLFFKDLLDRAQAARLVFGVDSRSEHKLTLDLRHRTAHASGGLLPRKGMAGNLPSGEAYIVPYEGEIPGEPTRSEGELPVQFADGVVVYQVRKNRAVGVRGQRAFDREEAARLLKEPAYGNLAELGLGVLTDFGVEPSGDLLLDEKLGLHIAFGRSDHFGGQVGPAQFSGPEAVVHLDRVYIKSLQPRVTVRSVDLEMDSGKTLPLMRDGRYVVDFKTKA